MMLPDHCIATHEQRSSQQRIGVRFYRHQGIQISRSQYLWSLACLLVRYSVAVLPPCWVKRRHWFPTQGANTSQEQGVDEAQSQ